MGYGNNHDFAFYAVNFVTRTGRGALRRRYAAPAIIEHSKFTRRHLRMLLQRQARDARLSALRRAQRVYALRRWRARPRG